MPIGKKEYEAAEKLAGEHAGELRRQGKMGAFIKGAYEQNLLSRPAGEDKPDDHKPVAEFMSNTSNLSENIKKKRDAGVEY